MGQDRGWQVSDMILFFTVFFTIVAGKEEYRGLEGPDMGLEGTR